MQLTLNRIIIAHILAKNKTYLSVSALDSNLMIALTTHNLKCS